MKDRIQQIIDFLGLNPNTFAHEIGVNRSTLSHVLNGRNKPSIDFTQKVLNRYSEISARWLLTGVGKMTLSEAETGHHILSLSSTENKGVKKIVVFYDNNRFEEFIRSE